MQEKNSKIYRRDYKRFKVDVLASIIFKQGIIKPLMIKEISARGLRGEIAYFPKMNEKVWVILHAPFFDNPVKKEAKVVWCKKIKENLWRIGLDFGLDNKLILDGDIKI